MYTKISVSGLILDASEEVDISDLRAEVKQLITENDSLTEDIDMLADENDHLTKGSSMSLYVHCIFT